MEAHEPVCWKNPNRHCPNCGDTGWQDEGEPCYWCSKVTPDSDAAKLLTAKMPRLLKELAARQEYESAV
jgi:hypothetical protein